MAQHKPTQRKYKTSSGRHKKRTPSTVGPSVRSTYASTGKPRKRTSSKSHAATEHASTLLTRRNFLYGALGLGAFAVVAGGVGAGVSLLSSRGDDEDVSVLEVPESAVVDSSKELQEIENVAECVSLVGSFKLPYGTLVWSNSDAMAACLLPTEDSSTPLTKVALLSFDTGEYPVVLEHAVGEEAGYDIYDVRANEQGLIWTEANIFDNVWRIFAAPFSDGSLGEPIMIDEGDAEWETPTLAASGNSAFWQVLPNLSGSHTTSDSLLKRVRFGSADTEEVYASTGRMCTPPYALSNGIVITPRTNTSGIHHQLTLLDADSCKVLDKLVLPASMKPLEAGYGSTGFTFSFEGTYSYGGGIKSMGTYAPTTSPTPEQYDALSWLHWNRAPTAAPAWLGKYFMVKSSTSVCGVDLSSNSYFSIDVENGSDKYGDYLATTGIQERIVTYANIDYTPLNGSEQHHCLIRVWAPT